MAYDIVNPELKKEKISFLEGQISDSNCKSLKELILKELILKEPNNKIKIIDFIEQYFNLNQKRTFVTSTSTPFNINNLKSNSISSLINLMRINDVRYVNKFIEAINRKLPDDGLFCGCVETYPNRKKALFDKYPIFLNWFVYLLDTFFNRVLPKLKITKKIYFYLTKGKGRVMSKAETFGRLYSCGFKIIDEKTVNNMLFFIAKKVKKPTYDKTPTYGALIILQRIGKDYKKFNVYKLRTMHPYSEYLQEYIYNQNNLQAGGKIKDDFRISLAGKFLRRFWIDELPMLINILKGNMKLVGVRPLSQHFFSLYSEDLQKLRTQFKPGLIPPFYADLPKTFDEIMESEKKYLNSCKKSQFITDLKYFLLAFKNIVFKGARSS